MAPTITLTAPEEGASFPPGETITISAEATDSDGTISRIEFYGDDTFLAYDVVLPYTFDWTDVDSGIHVGHRQSV